MPKLTALKRQETVLPSPTPGFRRGYAFTELPRLAYLRGETEVIRMKDCERSGEPKREWKVMDTPLEEYTFARSQKKATKTRINFEEYLLQELACAKTEGRTLRWLDVGGGTYEQWKPFLQVIELWGATLTEHLVSPGMRDVVKICTASELHKNFPKDYFDGVVSHYGIWNQERDGIENMLWVSKPGGNILVSGDINMPPFGTSIFYRIKAKANPDEKGGWFCWIEKRHWGPFEEFLAGANNDFEWMNPNRLPKND